MTIKGSDCAVTKKLIYETGFLRKGNINFVVVLLEEKFFSMMHCSCNIEVISYILYQDRKNQTTLSYVKENNSSHYFAVRHAHITSLSPLRFSIY